MREWRILAVVLVGSFMAALDTTIVNVALPSIAQGIKASSDALEWVVSGYALTFGLALVPAGRLGDRLGRSAVMSTRRLRARRGRSCAPSRSTQ